MFIGLYARGDTVDALISTSRGTAQGFIGRPAITLIFEQNLSHRPEPA